MAPGEDPAPGNAISAADIAAEVVVGILNARENEGNAAGTPIPA